MTTMRLTKPGPAFVVAYAEAAASAKERLYCRSPDSEFRCIFSDNAE